MARAKARRARSRTSRRGWGGRILGWILKGIVLFILMSLAWVLLYRFVNPPVTFTMMGDVIGGRSATRDWMPLGEIDPDMKRAVIAAEDSKFCSHWGFDQDAIAAAMRRNAEGGGVIRGGSTISQQTAKNAFLWQGGGYFRKGLEAWFTLLIENIWGKQRIMEVYLNLAETGITTYGVNAGAQRYFGKDASNLTRQEAARIAAVLPLPKKREAVTPTGFTRRYGNSIAARIRVVARDNLDACLDGSGRMEAVEPEGTPKTKAKAAPKQKQPVEPTPQPERAEDYIQPMNEPETSSPAEPAPPPADTPPVVEPDE
ncbi:monofunctional biosynthetic peptidoglycan transglycosylase [Allosphingosinicella flava]|uniref:Biosynthetic peptidoglycan transglycosylase n=1 Tax=Allosphingosinicella flava TaxID=2771430 RepID=A0A7T2GL19_9SPHN|nr:monofunctional biosynthetic peptidoglycan transglycosylase [Sphingosinicella flava]